MLAAVFHTMLPGDYPLALSIALACAVVITLLALVLAVVELRVRRARQALPEDAAFSRD